MYNKKIFFTVFSLCYALGLIACFVFSFFIETPQELLPMFSSSYWFKNFLLLIFKYFFVIHCSALIISYSYSFSRILSRPEVKRATFFFNELKYATILSIIFLFLFFSIQELWNPLLKKSQNNAIEISKSYAESVALAKKHIADEDYYSSLYYLDFALQINPDEKELVSLREIAFAKNDSLYLNQEPLASPILAVGEDKNLTSHSALIKAETAFAEKNWYDAHYYSTISTILCDKRNPNLEKAQRLAADAWNILNQQVFSEKQQKENNLHARKMAGYSLIQQGAFLDAYYHFYELKKDFPRDADVIRYFSVAKQGVEDSYFFTDEVNSISFFNSKTNLFARIPEDNGNFYILFAKKITTTSLKESTTAYIKDLSLVHVLIPQDSPDRKIIDYTIYTPYAKLFPVIRTKEDNTTVWEPIVLLHSVDNRIQGKDFRPVITGNTPLNSTAMLHLNIPIEEFSLLTNLALDAKELSTIALFKVAKLAPSAGLSLEIIYSEIAYRLTSPILFLIFSLFCLRWGWKYKIREGKQFNFFWIFFIPIVYSTFYIIFDLLTAFIYHIATFIIYFFGTSFAFLMPILFIILYCITVGIVLKQKK